MTAGDGATRKDVAVFVAGGGNGFMTDIAMWLVEAAAATGRAAKLIEDRLPDDPNLANLVVAPHELYVLSGADERAVAASCRISIPVCTEQPGTSWFRSSVTLSRPAPFALDINAHGVEALRSQQVRAERLLLGGVESMVAPPRARDVDVLFLGGDTPRRRQLLATLAPLLHDRPADLRLFRFTAPVRTGAPGLVFGTDKYRLLASAKLLVNIHRDDRRPGYFEWARMVEAMANGCVVVTEPCAGAAPLRPDEHFIETDDLAATVAELLERPARRDEIAAAAADAVLRRHPLSASVGPILERIDRLDLGARAGRRARPLRSPISEPRNVLREFRPATAVRERVFKALVAERSHRRAIESERAALRHGSADHITEHTTPAYVPDPGVNPPEVSVVVTLYNYGGLVTETLESIEASRAVTAEIVVVDDHSSDDGVDVVRRFMETRPSIPVLLLARAANRGLAAARNLGIARARAAKVMVMDADNLVYPRCLRRLSDALDDDPSAAFAYCTLEAFGADPGLRSHLDWHPPWLCEANYIDAQAMVRADTFLRHGGYLVDDRWDYGWEDWDLWLRMAAGGEHGVHVREMLGRYRTQVQSMISVTTLASDLLRRETIDRYPSLPWPERRRPGR
jgi:hypothetical protein